jgi:hypothetical protein
MVKSFIAITFVFASAFSFGQSDVANSSWISPVKIDGNPVEWSQPLRYYDHGTKLFFAFANDNKNLYLCFQTPDEITQMKIMHAGMKITLSTKGHDKHKASIIFPVTRKSETMQQPVENNNIDRKANHQNIKNSFLAQNTMMEVRGFSTKSGLIPINDSSGLNAAMNWDETNKLTYEISIPLEELFGTDYDASDMSKDISLNAEINAITRNNQGGSGGGHGGGRMGGSGGRMHGGGDMHQNRESNGENNSEINPDKTAIFEKSELKQKFVLAGKH